MRGHSETGYEDGQFSTQPNLYNLYQILSCHHTLIRHNDQSEPGMIASNIVVQNDTTTANRIMAHPGT